MLNQVVYQVWSSNSKDDWGHVVNSFETVEQAKEAAKKLKASYKVAGSRGLTIRIVQAKTSYFEIEV